MFTIIAYFSLTIAIVSFGLAIKGSYQWYWLSAVGMYIFSFLAGFSIGQLTVGITFIPLALAIGYFFRWIKNMGQYALFSLVGAIIGVILVMFVDDYFLFFPFIALLG